MRKIFFTQRKKKDWKEISQHVKRCLSLGGDIMDNLVTFCAFLLFPNVLWLNIFAFFFFLISKHVFGFVCMIRLNVKLAGWPGGLTS